MEQDRSKLALLEAKKRRYEAEVSRLQQAPIEYVEAIQSHPTFIKTNLHQELIADNDNLDEALQLIEQEMQMEESGFKEFVLCYSIPWRTTIHADFALGTAMSNYFGN
jgi:hypothetical protein